MAVTDSPQEQTEQVARSAGELWQTFVGALPRIGIAVSITLVFVLLGWALRWPIRQALMRTRAPSFAVVMSKVAAWTVAVIGVLLALAVTFPSIQPVDILAGLGFFSVAVGFAFKDILQNLLAGVLLLFREPFAAGDQIRVKDHEGSVERITIRETMIRTFDGKRVLIPNADVYQNAIEIQTAFPQRRISFIVGVAYEADAEKALQVVADALAKVDGVDPSPEPSALLVELAAATVNLEAQFWTAPRQADVLAVTTRAMATVKQALENADIEMPSDIVALQATSSFAAALRGEPVTPGGGLPRRHDAAGSATGSPSRQAQR